MEYVTKKQKNVNVIMVGLVKDVINKHVKKIVVVMVYAIMENAFANLVLQEMDAKYNLTFNVKMIVHKTDNALKDYVNVIKDSLVKIALQLVVLIIAINKEFVIEENVFVSKILQV